MSVNPGNVPLCDLRSQYAPLRDELIAAFTRVLDSGQVVLGGEVAAFEEEVAEYCGVGHAVGCGSGTEAISLALAALDVGPGDEVIIPPFTFFATVGCVVRLGATPVFADIDAKTFNLDPVQVANKITPRTKAIIPVHLYGQCADMEPIWAVAERHGLTVIEDAAQAFGAEYRGKKAGSLGGIACFSFYPSKNLGGYGDSGMVVTNDPDWAARMRRLRVHGMEPKYYHPEVGWNARIDPVQAAMLRVKLPFIDEWIEGRRQAASRYDSLVEHYHLDGFLDRPKESPYCRHTFNQYVVRVSGGRRDAMAQHLKSNGIGCDVYYPLPLHFQECLEPLGHRQGEFPVSEAAAGSVLALPMFPELSPDQQLRVIETCAEFARSGTRRAA